MEFSFFRYDEKSSAYCDISVSPDSTEHEQIHCVYENGVAAPVIIGIAQTTATILAP